MDKLESLGYGDWFRRRVDVEKTATHEVARVVSVHKCSYVVTKGHGEVFANLSGNLFHLARSSSDLPTTGDWIYAEFHDNDSQAIIHGVAPRKTLLRRKKAGKGRHTTTSRELIQLENGALLIDTPGMRELGTMSVDTGLDKTFPKIFELAQLCKFGNCSHTSEKGCAILAATEEGELTEQRYQNYIKMKNESAFNEMSYHEKRKKDKTFGKVIKSVQKRKKRR